MHADSLLAIVATVAFTIPPACTPVPGAVSSARDSAHADGMPLTILDAIRMVRIEDRYGTNRDFVAMSPDASHVATVLWRGDLERNVNVYSLLVFGIDEARARARTVEDALLSIEFEGDSLDQAATPIDQLVFLADNRTVAFLGSMDGGPRKVLSVDGQSGRVRTLAGHATDISAFAITDDGARVVYAVSVPTPADTARENEARRSGVFPYDPEVSRDPQRFAALASVYIPAFQPNFLRSGHQFFTSDPGSSDEPTLVFDSRRDAGRRPSIADLGWEGVDPSAVRGSLAAAVGAEERRPEAPRSADHLEHFNRRRPVVTDARGTIGVVDSTTEPPELAYLDDATGELTVLTDLNPQLRSRRYGEVEQIRLSTPLDSASTAWLVKPVDFEAGRRYPLVVLLANEPERAWDHSYIIDGRQNLSGHAVQPLAAMGIMVLYIGEQPSSSPGRAGEIDAMIANIEGAVRHLSARGYADTTRVGVSGWSRSAWYTEQLLMRSSFAFSAATQIDGGSVHYGEQMRPYTDAELAAITTPFLAQAHGQLQFAYQGAMVDRLRALGRPADLLYFATAPHSTRQPGHRLRSLTTHVDWWRFWLQDLEDPAPEKVGQYRRWREMRGSAADGDNGTKAEPPGA